MVTCPAAHPLDAAPHTASTDWWCDCCGATFRKGHPELSPQCWRCEDTRCRHRFCAPCVARRVVCATDHLLSRRLFPVGDKSALLHSPCLRCGRKPANDVDQKTEKATVVLFACEPCATFVCAACVAASTDERSQATTSASNAALAPHPPPQKGHSGSRPAVGTEPQSIIHPHRPADAPARQSPRRARTDAAGPLSVPQETGAPMDPRMGNRLRSSSRASSNSYHDPGLLTPTSSNGTVPPLGRRSSADAASPIGAEDVFLEPQFSCVGGAVMVDSEMFSAASFGNIAPHNAMSGAMRMSSGIDGSPGSVASIGPAVAQRSTPPICPRCVVSTLLLPAVLATATCAVCQDTLRAGMDAAYSCGTSTCGYAVCAACSAPPSEAARAAVAATLGVEGLAEGISTAAVSGSRPQQRRRRRERGHSNPFLKQGGGSSTYKCPNGHPLRSAAVLLPWQCDACNTEHDAGTTAFQCRQCDHDLCLGCESAAAAEHSDGLASPASPADTGQQSPFSPVDAKHKLLRPGRKPVDRQRPLVCPASHRLAPQSLQVEWVCDQCGGDYDGGDPGLGCRRCDFDLCLPCAHATLGGRRATRRHMSRRQLPHGTSSSSAARCPKSHPLQQSPMSVAWRCALCCGNFLPATIPWSCHLCHFEACPGCAAGADPPSSDSSSSGLDEDAADGNGAENMDGVTCCAGHPVKPHKKDLPWACDGCLAHHKAHTTSAGCRRCGYDLCSACVAVEQAAGQSPMQSPLGGGLGLASAARQQRGSFVKTERPSGACRAVLIGINYEGSASELRGCVNDVRTVMKVVDVLGFRPTERRVLVDDLSFAGRTGHPTHAEILDALRWLCRTAAPGDTLFVHYSGHGGRQVDLDGDESDGYDEALVPVDSDTAGLVTDDDIFDALCRDLPAGVRLTCLADCCHSGSLLDLQYAWQWDGAEGEAASPASPVSLASPASERSGSELSPEPSMVKGMGRGGSSSKNGAVAARPRRPTREESILNRGFKEDSKKTCAADVVLLSACRDSEKTGDVASRSTARSTAVYTGPGSAGGACTNALVEVLGPAIAGHAAAPCFGDLLLAMQANLRRRRFQQVPVLSASVKVRMQRPFSLFGAL